MGRWMVIFLLLVAASQSAAAQVPQVDAVGYIDSSDVEVTDIYYWDGGPSYWTGNAFWPVSSATGEDALSYDGFVQRVVYLASDCTGTSFAQDNNGRVRVLKDTNVGPGGGTAQEPVSTVTYQSGASCYAKHAVLVCGQVGCPGAPWRHFESAGTLPDLSGYDVPIRPAICL